MRLPSPDEFFAVVSIVAISTALLLGVCASTVATYRYVFHANAECHDDEKPQRIPALDAGTTKEP